METSLLAKRLNHWFWIFVFLHLIAWTLVPYLARYNLPMDSVEGFVWGQHLQWGYDKNPFLNGWLTRLATYIDNYNGWAIYFFSQVSVVICFIATWSLAKKIFTPLQAFVSVLLLESMQYYNLHVIDFNDNTLELGTWALTTLFLYKSLKKPNWVNWGLTGLFAGLALMTKYYTVVLLMPLFLFMVCNHKARQSFSKLSTYFGLCIFFIVISPHFKWLAQHEFITLNYALRRTSTIPEWSNHIAYSLRFAWEQFEVLLPAIILFSLFWICKKEKTSRSININSFDKQFIGAAGAGPFLLTLIISCVMGIRLRAGWGVPLLSLSGMLLIIYSKPNLTFTDLKRFTLAVATVTFLTLIFYAVALIRASAPSSANFPGKNIAYALTDEWRKTFHTPLYYIAGSRGVAGYVAYESPDHPSVFINWDAPVSSWIDLQDLRQKGAIFVWAEKDDAQKSLAEVKSMFPSMTNIKIMEFSWLRNIKMKPVVIKAAFLPPITQS